MPGVTKGDGLPLLHRSGELPDVRSMERTRWSCGGTEPFPEGHDDGSSAGSCMGALESLRTLRGRPEAGQRSGDAGLAGTSSMYPATVNGQAHIARDGDRGAQIGCGSFPEDGKVAYRGTLTRAASARRVAAAGESTAVGERGHATEARSCRSASRRLLQEGRKSTTSSARLSAGVVTHAPAEVALVQPG